MSKPSTGGVGKSLLKAGGKTVMQMAPGAAEGTAVAEGITAFAARFGLARVFGAAMAGAKAPGPAAIGGAAGAVAGYSYENEARAYGFSEPVAVGYGTLGALATGATVAGLAVLIVATGPVSLPVLGGVALVGGLSGMFGYLTSRSMAQ